MGAGSFSKNSGTMNQREAVPLDQATHMTEGSPWKHILKFAWPVFLGNLFQQLYNVADSLVVGNFTDEYSLGAVVSSGSLIFMLVGFFSGVFTGAGAVIARYFGARDKEKLQSAVHTSVALGLVSGIGMSLLGVVISPVLLRWIGTPDNIFPKSVIYFRIYFSGCVFVILYNTAAGILQAVGDSKYPLRLLLISSVTNVVLDLLFVGVFQMDVGGAALATVISQALSAVLAFRHLLRVPSEYRVQVGRIRFEGPMLRQILGMGLPSGVQNSIIALANLVVQSSINMFGELAVAGCGCYSKIDGFAFLPITSFSLALATFISQNIGAGKPDRARQGARFGIVTALIMAEIIGVVFRLFAPQFLTLFGCGSDAVSFGVRQTRVITLFYFLLAFSHIIAGIMRGAGRAIVPMLVMTLCWCVVRVSYLLLVAQPSGNIEMVFWCYPLTWFLSSVIFLIYYLFADWPHYLLKKSAAGVEEKRV